MEGELSQTSKKILIPAYNRLLHIPSIKKKKFHQMKKWGGVNTPKTTVDRTVSLGLGMSYPTNTLDGE